MVKPDILPHRVTPEMVVRMLMSQMDQIDSIAVACTIKDSPSPQVMVSTEISPYFLVYMGNMLAKMGLGSAKRQEMGDDDHEDD